MAEGGRAQLVLVRNARAGDQFAFMDLLSPVLPAAHRIAVGMLGRPADAEDAVQDAVLNAWRHLSSFHEDHDFKPWFLTIVVNQCRMQRRSRWWNVLRMAQPIEDTIPAPAVPSLDGTDLRLALDRLPHHHRLVLVLRFYLDQSYEDIGRMLHVSANAARIRTHRALKKLRRIAPEILADE